AIPEEGDPGPEEVAERPSQVATEAGRVLRRPQAGTSTRGAEAAARASGCVAIRREARVGSGGLVQERDVAGRYIHHVNVQRLQRFQNGLHPWPESAELLSLLRFPFGPRLLREIRRCVQPGTCEIQDEWTCDDTHLDDAQLVVETNELRNIESQNLTHARVPQPFVHLTLAEIRLDGTVYFEGRFTGFGLVFSHEDDTVNSETQPLGELKLMLRSKGLSVLDQNFFHGGAIESGRA